MMHADIKETLLAHAEEKHALFVSKLIPTATLPILGVRMGTLHRLAKQVARGDWRSYHQQAPAPESMEELMVQGLSLGYLPASTGIEEQLCYLAALVPQLDNWSLCDSCICSYKFVKRHRERVWDWLQDYLLSRDEYLARFGVVMLIFHYASEADYTPLIAAMLPQLKSGAYYTDMAVAWCVCELYALHKGEAEPLLEDGALPAITQKMARQKIRDSYRCELD